MVIVFTQILTRWLQIEHERNIPTQIFPILIFKLNTEMIGDCFQMNRRIG